MRCAAGVLLALAAAAPLPAQEITAATYSAPTSRYTHGVLGDDEEWGKLSVVVSRNAGSKEGLFHGSASLTYEFNLPQELVFEDTAPRLWDITGDGQPEVVVVQSHADLGARLLVIGLNDQGKPAAIADTPFIGQRNRWLAPVGAADLDGDGHIEIAYIDRPHLAKTLRIWRYADGAFTQIASVPGVSNHRIGEDYVSGGLRDCGAGPELIVASGDWRDVVAVTLAGDQPSTRVIGRFEGRGSFDRVLGCG